VLIPIAELQDRLRSGFTLKQAFTELEEVLEELGRFLVGMMVLEEFLYEGSSFE
jgi:hypothetical protein